MKTSFSFCKTSFPGHRELPAVPPRAPGLPTRAGHRERTWESRCSGQRWKAFSGQLVLKYGNRKKWTESIPKVWLFGWFSFGAKATWSYPTSWWGPVRDCNIDDTQTGLKHPQNSRPAGRNQSLHRTYAWRIHLPLTWQQRWSEFHETSMYLPSKNTRYLTSIHHQSLRA